MASAPEDVAAHWLLEPGIAFLNHGSFGACPKVVLAAQAALRARLEAQPVRFLARELEARLDAARAELAAFVGAAPKDLAFVPNATAGINAVLRSLRLAAGDELVVTDHEYGATRNAVEYAAARAGARVVVARVPFPLRSPDEVLEHVLAAVGPRARLVVIDHVTSQTGLVLPLERLLGEFDRRGVDVLVDGAHAPGMLPLDVGALGAAYYTGNCHKWVCAPKGAAFLHVREDRQREVRPLSISHGASSPRRDRSRFLLEFDWTGTDDPTAYLCVPEALRFMGSLLPGGWAALRESNRQKVLAGRKVLCAALGVDEPCPAEMLGSLASVPLRDGPATPPASSLYLDPLQDELWERHGIEVPMMPWPAPPRRLLRISAQLYNDPGQYVRLAQALGELLATDPRTSGRSGR